MNSAAFKRKAAAATSINNRRHSHKIGMPDLSNILGPLDRINAILDERLAARKRGEA